eukprot:PhM_4_TR8349/c0_g1_i2/m.17921
MVLVCRGATFLPEVPVPATVQKQLLIVVHAYTKESMAKLFRVSAESYVQLIASTSPAPRSSPGRSSSGNGRRSPTPRRRLCTSSGTLSRTCRCRRTQMTL